MRVNTLEFLDIGGQRAVIDTTGLSGGEVAEAFATARETFGATLRRLYRVRITWRPEYLASLETDECDCPACRAQRRKMAH